MGRRIILTSYGLTSSVGRKLIFKALKDDDLSDEKIFLFHELHYSLEEILRNVCVSMGFKPENIILSGEQSSNTSIADIDFLYCTEGNTYEIMSLLRERGLDKVFVEAFRNGATYIGASAGAMIAGDSIEEALYCDKNFVGVTDFRGLSLFEGTVLPHYTKTEAKRYIKNSLGIKKKYNQILSVANDKMLILEV